MPGVYYANPGAAPATAGGVCLPFPTTTTGPLLYPDGERGLRRYDMGKPGHTYWIGYEEEISRVGFCTRDASDCVVICIATRKNGTWHNGYFQHIPGGEWHPEREIDWSISIAAVSTQIEKQRESWAVVMTPSTAGLRTMCQRIRDFGVPYERMSVYVSFRSTSHFAISFSKPYPMFGETGGGGGIRGGAPGYGYRGTVQQVYGL